MAKDKGGGGPEAGLVLPAKAEGTLLTGASLSRETEAADGPWPWGAWHQQMNSLGLRAAGRGEDTKGP